MFCKDFTEVAYSVINYAVLCSEVIRYGLGHKEDNKTQLGTEKERIAEYVQSRIPDITS
jgi:hypothetical protein